MVTAPDMTLRQEAPRSPMTSLQPSSGLTSEMTSRPSPWSSDLDEELFRMINSAFHASDDAVVDALNSGIGDQELAMDEFRTRDHNGLEEQQQEGSSCGLNMPSFDTP